MASPLLFWSLLIFFSILSPIFAESLACIDIYREGSAPAVFTSPQCPQWNLPAFSTHFRSSLVQCNVATNQGRRASMEDRAFCALGLNIPFPDVDPNKGGKMIMKEIKDVGIIAVFDGHNGAEASEMAASLFGEYFLLHTYFISDSRYHTAVTSLNGSCMHNEENIIHGLQDYLYVHREGLDGPILENFSDDSFHMEILKESLVRALNDIDLTFSKMALKNGLKSGSTAAVVLIANGQILAANVGDSKAFLCSEDSSKVQGDRRQMALARRERRKRGQSLSLNNQVADGFNGITLRSSVKELTCDHHPDREDERNRIEAAGGYISEWADVVRVNGQLAVSRSIGDVLFKQYGVISTPEVTDWQAISGNNTHLIATSDGVLEKLTTQEACDILFHDEVRSGTREGGADLASLLLAEALEKGTRDNVAAVVVPLNQYVRAGTVLKE